jgi:transcriptional regulator with XRE-family HTH domain
LTHYPGELNVTTFGDKLKDLRQAVGWSQPQLAEYSGVPVGTIRDYEQGRRDPLLLTAAKLARALKQPLEVFLAADVDAAPRPAGPSDQKPAAKKKIITKKKE